MKRARLFRLLLLPVLAHLYIGEIQADDHLPKNSNWVLVGPNKGWWKEVQVPLDYRVWLGNLGGPSVWLTLTNDTNVAVTVQLGNAQPQNVLKEKGMLTVDPREVLTTICAYGDRPVYYVDDANQPTVTRSSALGLPS